MAVVQTVTLTGSISHDARWSDGMGITHSDLNDAMSFKTAFLNDCIIGTAAELPVDLGPRANVVWTAGNMTLLPDFGNRSITNYAGTIWVRNILSAPTGLTPVFLPYYLDNDALATDGTVILADATNPMWYGIFLSVARVAADSQTRDFQDAVTGVVTSSSSLMKNQIQLTKTVVSGTPAANPVPPTAPGSTAPLCYIYVPANHNTVLSNAHIHDLRLPMGRKSVFVPARAWEQISGTFTFGDNPDGFGASSGQGEWMGGTGTLEMKIPVPVSNPQARLIGLTVHGGCTTMNNFELRTRSYGSNLVDSLAQTLSWPGAGNLVNNVDVSTPSYAGGLTNSVPWCNGLSSPYPSTTYTSHLMLRIRATGSGIGPLNRWSGVRFDFLGAW